VIVSETPKAIIIQSNNDGTQTITTNKIDYSQTEIKTIVHTLKQSNIESSNIQSIKTTEGAQ